MKNGVDLYGKAPKREGQFESNARVCKTFEKASDRTWYVDEDQRVGFMLFYHLKT